MTKTRWGVGVSAVMLAALLGAGGAPPAEAAGSHSFAVSCKSGSNSHGATMTYASGGSSASTSVTDTFCTRQLAVRAVHHRNGGGQAYYTEWAYTYLKTTKSISVSPGGVINGHHKFLHLDDEWRVVKTT